MQNLNMVHRMYGMHLKIHMKGLLLKKRVVMEMVEMEILLVVVVNHHMIILMRTTITMQMITMSQKK